MNIVIASPLFPPETTALGQFNKNLARHMSKENKVSVITYANEVETVKGVKIIKILKKQVLACRLFEYSTTLLKAAKTADIILVQNALACIIPALLVSKLSKVKIVIMFAEDEAQKRASQVNLANKFLNKPLTRKYTTTKMKAMKYLQKLSLNKFQNIICPSSVMKDLVISKYKTNQNKITTIEIPKPDAIKLPFETKIEESDNRLNGWDQYSRKLKQYLKELK